MRQIKLFLRNAMLLCALALVFNASAQTFQVKSVDWLGYSGTYEVNSKYYQSAVTDGAIFALPAPTEVGDMHPDSPEKQQCTKGFKVYKSGSNRESIITETFSGGSALEHYPVKRSASENGYYYYMGPAIASDDAGNLWTHTMRGDAPGTASADWQVGIHTFTYYTERPAKGVPGTKTTINLDVLPNSVWMSNIAYLMSANGDGANGTGYIWIAAANAPIARYTIENGAFKAKKTYSTPLSGGKSPDSRYCYVKQHGNKVYYTTPAYNGTTTTAQAIYRGELSADGSSVEWESTPIVTDNYSPQFTVFTLCNHDILVYNSFNTTYANENPYRQITIYDMTSKSVIDKVQTIYISSRNSYIRQSLNATVVDECNAYIYGFIPGVGVYRYPVVATPENSPVSNISVSCSENLNYIGRQDATISWKAPESAKSYMVYYKSSYVNGAGTTISSDWVKIGETANTSITHDDVCWTTVLENDERKYYSRSYTYKVIPVYENGVFGKEAVSSTLTPDFMPSAPIWVEVDPVKDNKGYCIVSLLWKEWHGYGCQPQYYNVIRDDKEINYRNGEILEIGGSNYVDTTCVSGAIYRYRIEAVYPNEIVPEQYLNYLHNEDKIVSIATRDWAKPRYSISKVYEYKIVGKEGDDYSGYDGRVLPDAKEFPNFHSEPDCYRQGVFYNGCWYISQYTNDNTATQFQHDPFLEKTTLKGGILRFLGDDPRAEIPNDNVKYPSTYPQISAGVYAEKTISRRPLVSYHRENQCIAVDNSGTFLTRGLRTGWSYDVNSWEDNNNYALACSSIEFHNFDKNWHGSFDLPSSLVKELEASAVAESLRTGDDTRPGRVDYFSAQGDLYNDGWCYLYMAPMVSKTAFRVKLVKSGGTVYVPEGNWIKFEEDGTNPNFTYAEENYAFPVNCENRKGEEYVYEQLKNIYSLQSGDGTTQKASASDRAIYNSSTFVNAIGGTTFEFNNELFMVAPQGQYPGNTGSFLVGMANRFTENGDGSWTNNGAANADMTDIIPTAQWYTGKANTDATETNGLWIHAEQAKDANGNIVDENKDGMTDYAYIYTYRPGLMFGKYILQPNTFFPPSQVYLSIYPQYDTNENGENVDLKQYDASASWSEVENYATTGGNFYQIQGYTLTIYDVEEKENGSADGNDGKVGEITFDLTGENAVKLNPDGTISDALGNIIKGLTYTTYTTTENGQSKEYHTFKYEVEDIDAVGDNGEKRDFIAYVNVNYEGVPGETTAGKLFDSAQTEYVNANTYIPTPPSASTRLYKHSVIWKYDTNKDGVINDEYKDGVRDSSYQWYYVYMDITAPQGNEPVTNYTLTVDTDRKNGADRDITNFYLYDPIDPITGTNYTGLIPDEDGYVYVEAVRDENGNIITPATIPGTYDFEKAKAALEGQKETDLEGSVYEKAIVKWTFKDNVDIPDADGDNVAVENDYAKWNFIVNANYAANNPKISTSTNGGETFYSGTLTGIEAATINTTVSIYPNPAYTHFNVSSSMEIGQLYIVSADGRIVKSLYINDSNATINVEDLAAGVYVVKVNGLVEMLIKK